MSAYAELHCASNFSFLRGASHPEELVERALALEYTALAITDECSFAGSVRAHLALRDLREQDAAARDFRLIHGTELRLADGPRMVLLAQTRAGYGNLSQLVSLGRRQAPKGSYRLSMADLQAHAHWLDSTLALLIPPPAAIGRKYVPDPDFLFIEQARWLAAQMPGPPEFDTKRCKLLICIGAPFQAATTATTFERRRRVS